MSSGGGRERFRVALVSAPWPMFNRPSIQLGSLKAYVSLKMPSVDVTTYHFYLPVAAAIGYRTYQALCERTWLAESVYAALMFPQRIDRIEALFRREAAGKADLAEIYFRDLVARVDRVSQELLRKVDWSRLGLVGFSLSLCQLTASLYFIRQVRRAAPRTVIVVGGSTFSGSAARRLIQGFPNIDAVVQGEGEQPLAAILSQLMKEGKLLRRLPGVVIRDGSGPQDAFSQLPHLDELPVPDYDDYFRLLGSLPPDRRFFATLPVEASRGCWWRRPMRAGRMPGCAFCNLNLQWKGYRSKSPEKVVEEVDRLSRRYQLLSLAFMDNVLPRRDTGRLFAQLAQLGKDFKFFAEIRAGFEYRSLSIMAAAGVEEVQVGIEALSSTLLARLNKGTRAIENLEIMKNCEALGIRSRSNLILYFPGSDARDVSETLKVLEFAMVFRPLRVVGFWLGAGSPVWADPSRYGIILLGNHRYYRTLFPEEISRNLEFMIQAYRGDLTRQRRLWRPVKEKVCQWQRRYTALHADGQAGPILSYRDGGNFLIIRQRRLEKKPLIHRLKGVSRQVYLFCERRRCLAHITQRFGDVDTDQLISFLKMMVSMRLMFNEGDEYLSLAVAHRPSAGGTSRHFAEGMRIAP